jgi:mannose-6-phosphate isomerase
VLVRPIELGPNQPRQFYRGGGAIAALRGVQAEDGYRPEDWVASTTSRFGLGEDGQSSLPDGTKLADAVTADPEAWLGRDHQAYFGANTALLVKFLEAGQRLPVHVHPPRSFAYRHLGSFHGKTEAWVVLGAAGARPTVYLGWKRDVPYEEMAGWVAEQDTAAMLANMNELEVKPGTSVLVPAGTPHAIGEGVFCVELQEPSDFSIMLEFKGFDIDPAGGDLGLGREAALACVREKAFTPEELEALQQRHAPLTLPEGPAGPAPTADDNDLLPEQSRPYFRAHRLGRSRPGPVAASFAVLIGTWGEGSLSGDGWEVPVRRGSTLVVPYGAGQISSDGDVELVRCLPPLPADSARDDPRAGRA